MKIRKLFGVSLCLLGLVSSSTASSFNLKFEADQNVQPTAGITCGLAGAPSESPYPPGAPVIQSYMYLGKGGSISGEKLINEVRVDANTTTLSETWAMALVIQPGTNPVGLSYTLGANTLASNEKITISYTNGGSSVIHDVVNSINSKQLLATFTYAGTNGSADVKYITVTYDKTILQSGNLIVNFTGSTQYTGVAPQVAASAGKWKLTTEVDAVYRNSGEALSRTVGQAYTVQFKSVPGWTAPANISGTMVAQGQTYSVSYSEDLGALSVPEVVRDGLSYSWTLSGTALTGQIYSATGGPITPQIVGIPTGTYALTYTLTADAAIRYENAPSASVTIAKNTGNTQTPNFVEKVGDVNLSVSEVAILDVADGGRKDFSVSLTSQPTHDVVVTFTKTGLANLDLYAGGSEVTSVTFTKDDWNAKVLTLLIDNTGFTASQVGVVTATATSGDTRYSNEVDTLNVALIKESAVTAKSLSVGPADLDFGDVRTGKATTFSLLAKNTSANPETVRVYTANTNLTFRSTTYTIAANSEVGIPVKYNALAALEGAKIYVVDSTGAIITSALTANATISNDPSFAILRPKKSVVAVKLSTDGNPVNTKFEYELETSAPIGTPYEFKITFPTAVDIHSVAIGAVNNQELYVSGNVTTGPKMTFSFTAPVTTGTTDIDPINVSDVIVNGVTTNSSQDGQLAISNAVKVGNVDVDDSGVINSADLTYVFYGYINTFTKNDYTKVAPSSFGLSNDSKNLIWDNIQTTGSLLDVDESGVVNAADLTYIFYGAINTFTKNDYNKVAPNSFGLSTETKLMIWENVQSLLP